MPSRSTARGVARLLDMETRLTLRPGQNGTKKLLERYGELIVEAVAWRPRPRHPRRSDDEIVAVRIAYPETDLRGRAKRLGAVWRPAQKLWEITWRDAKRLGIADRVQRSDV